ncbi:MAG: hypothetical protein ACO1OC_02125, partial [Tuberibacillus sp.]
GAFPKPTHFRFALDFSLDYYQNPMQMVNNTILKAVLLCFFPENGICVGFYSWAPSQIQRISDLL